MNWNAMLLSAAIGLATMPAMASDSSAQSAATTLVSSFMQAWTAADADRLSALFAADADFINPDGYAATGRDQIKAFYAMAFANGYAGSKGTGDIVTVREIARDVAVIDGRWKIEGAKTPEGAARPAEKGILVAVIRRQDGAWRIVTLRENTSATEIVPFMAAAK